VTKQAQFAPTEQDETMDELAYPQKPARSTTQHYVQRDQSRDLGTRNAIDKVADYLLQSRLLAIIGM
jgi:hypothetical protein